MKDFRAVLSLASMVSLSATASVVVYQNDFSTRTSEGPVPSAQWMCAPYVKGNIASTYNASAGRDGCQYTISANNNQQDGWYKAYDGDAALSSRAPYRCGSTYFIAGAIKADSLKLKAESACVPRKTLGRVVLP